MLIGVKGKKNCTGQVSMENAYLNKIDSFPAGLLRAFMMLTDILTL